MAVTVVITNFNGAQFLPDLLAQLREQKLSHIVVLDDASTDDSVPYLEQQPDITLVKGEVNLGPAGNRNRILNLETHDIIWFLDVDMKLLTEDIPGALEKEFAGNEAMGALGALIYGGRDTPMRFNWGYDFTPLRVGATAVLREILEVHKDNPEVVETVCRAAIGRFALLEPVRTRDVDWVAEGFFAIRASVFREVGGFDPKFRMFHEGPDICLRIRQTQRTVRFTTDIRAKHLDLASGSPAKRNADENYSTAYYFRKHYGVSAETLNRLLHGL